METVARESYTIEPISNLTVEKADQANNVQGIPKDMKKHGFYEQPTLLGKTKVQTG